MPLATDRQSSAFDFASVSTRAAGDADRKRIINNAVLKQYTAREERLRDLPDSDALRTLAAEIRKHAVDNLDYYLQQLKVNVERRGGQVHFAATAADARRIVDEIIARTGAKRIIKSKSMVSEEVQLAHHLEAQGLDVVETDLGEFIVQIDHDKPSHIVAPIVHKDRVSIAKLFASYFETPYNEDATAMTMQARAHLRDKFRRADLGMTGGNFLVAETGQVVVVENEGNARQSMTSPRILVSMVGMEKVIPRLADLSVMLKLLARSATGQHMTIYTSIFGGPRSAEEKDGPEEFHLILVDNGRSEILASEYRETLHCIRCGACLNACPVYRKISGHSYGHVYSGPIGALIAPLFNGLGNYKDLPQASSLCGACYEACPVKINIPQHLINMRRDIVQQKLGSWSERLLHRVWALSLQSTAFYRLGAFFQKFTLRRRARDGWISRLPMPGTGWTAIRDMPAPAEKTFRQLWQNRRAGEKAPTKDLAAARSHFEE